jgi:hypothetical protein
VNTSAREMYVRMSSNSLSPDNERCWHRRDPATITTLVSKTFCELNVSLFLRRTWDVLDVRDQDPHCGTCFPEDWNPMGIDPMGIESIDAMRSRPERLATGELGHVPYVPRTPADVFRPDPQQDLQDRIDALLSELTREQLRRLAWDALMLSDGPASELADPDKDQFENSENSMFSVAAHEPVYENGPAAFHLVALRGWSS